MVANTFIAPRMHGERLHPHLLTSTVLVLLGCAAAVGTADHTNEVCGVEALFATYATPRFAAYVVVVVALLVGGVVLL